MRFAALALAANLVIAIPAAASDEAGKSLPLDLTLRIGVWTSNRALDDRDGSLSAALNAKTTTRAGAGFSTQLDAYLATQSRGATRAIARVRDGYLRYEDGPLDVRAGWQSVVWGRADAINPTDQLTPRDYRLRVPSDDEQRFGVPALKMGWYFDEINQLSLHMQQFRASIAPLDATLPINRKRRGDAEWAVRYDRSGAAVDWSLSWFSGFSKPRYLALQTPVGAPDRVVRDYPRIETLGADLATNVHGYGLRAEIARTWVVQGLAPEAGGKAPGIAAVVGIDRNLENETNINLQYFIQHLYHSSEPANPVLAGLAIANNQIDPHRTGFTVRYAKQQFDSRFSWEVQAIGYFGRRDYALRTRCNYRVDQRLRMLAGFDLFGGKSGAYYDSLRRNNTAFLELRWAY